MVTTLGLGVSVVLQLLAAGLALLIKVTGNSLAWMFRALSLSSVISTQISNFLIVLRMSFNSGNRQSRARIDSRGRWKSGGKKSSLPSSLEYGLLVYRGIVKGNRSYKTQGDFLNEKFQE